MIEDLVLNRIKDLLTFRHWSVYRLAKEAGLSYSSLNNLMNRGTCPTIATLEKICNGFGIGLSEFFDFRENPLHNDTLSPDEEFVLNCYGTLSKKDKELLKVYLSGLGKRGVE